MSGRGKVESRQGTFLYAKKKGSPQDTSKVYKDQYEGLCIGQIWNHLCIKMSNEVLDNILDNKKQSLFLFHCDKKKQKQKRCGGHRRGGISFFSFLRMLQKSRE